MLLVCGGTAQKREDLLSCDARTGVLHGEFDLPPLQRKVTVISPSKVNLKALDRRLRTIFSHISPSMYTGSGSGGQSIINLRPARSMADRNMLARSGREDGKVRGFIGRLYACCLDPREIEQGIDQLKETKTVALDDSRRSRPSGCSRSSSSSGPMTSGAS